MAIAGLELVRNRAAARFGFRELNTGDPLVVKLTRHSSPNLAVVKAVRLAAVCPKRLVF